MVRTSSNEQLPDDVKRRDLAPAPVVTIASSDPYKLRDLLVREHARRALLVRSEVREVEPGLWEVDVVQLRTFERPWVKPAVVAGSAAGIVAASAAVGWWLVGALVDVVAGAAAAAGASILGVLAVLVLVLWVTGRRSRGVSVDVKVRVR